MDNFRISTSLCEFSSCYLIERKCPAISFSSRTVEASFDPPPSCKGVCFGKWSNHPTYRWSRAITADLAKPRHERYFSSPTTLPSDSEPCGYNTVRAMSALMNFRNCGSLLVTGASRGLGLQIVDSLASGGFSPGKIIATTRQPASAQVNAITRGQ